MQPYDPTTMVIGAQILPAQGIATDATFGTVTMRLSVRVGSATAQATNTPLYSLPTAVARAIAQELLDAADQAEKQFGKQL